MKIVLTAALAFALAAPKVRAQPTAAVPNDNAANDISQTTAQPLGRTPGSGVASNPNEQNAKSPLPQEGMETHVQPAKHGHGKTSKSRIHRARKPADGAPANPDTQQRKQP